MMKLTGPAMRACSLCLAAALCLLSAAPGITAHASGTDSSGTFWRGARQEDGADAGQMPPPD